MNRQNYDPNDLLNAVSLRDHAHIGVSIFGRVTITRPQRHRQTTYRQITPASMGRVARLFGYYWPRRVRESIAEGVFSWK